MNKRNEDCHQMQLNNIELVSELPGLDIDLVRMSFSLVTDFRREYLSVERTIICANSNRHFTPINHTIPVTPPT